jgi:hypothetical protein
MKVEVPKNITPPPAPPDFPADRVQPTFTPPDFVIDIGRWLIYGALSWLLLIPFLISGKLNIAEQITGALLIAWPLAQLNKIYFKK